MEIKTRTECIENRQQSPARQVRASARLESLDRPARETCSAAELSLGKTVSLTQRPHNATEFHVSHAGMLAISTHPALIAGFAGTHVLWPGSHLGLGALESHSALQSRPMYPHFPIRHFVSARAVVPTTALLLIMAALAACSGNTAPAVESGGGALSQALKLTPSDTGYLSVTDWQQVKASAGHGDVTSQSSQIDRSKTYKDVLANEAEVSQFVADTSAPDQNVSTLPGASVAPNQLSPQAQAWGFDAMDLDWDASVVSDSGTIPVQLLHLRPGVDMNAIQSTFDQKNYKKKQVAGFTVRTLGGDLGSNPAGTSSAMSNTAFLSDGRTLAISESLDALEAYLHGLGSSAPPEIVAAAGQLGSPWASAIIGGTHACGFFDPPAGWQLDPSYQAAINGEIASVGSLSPFEAVAIGYSRQNTPIGRLSFIYANPDDAKSDLSGRLALAQQARRLAQNHETYATTIFTVGGSSVDGNALNIDLTPVLNQPIKLFQAFGSRDLVPAVCQD